jgi:hypothetical protein
MVIGGCLLGAVAAAARDGASKRLPMDQSLSTSAAGGLLQPVQPAYAGTLFGQPVSMENYLFAKRVAYMFPRPWGAADMPEAEREDVIWESLILHFESFRRGITTTDEQVNTLADEVLKGHGKTFTRRGDPDAYRRWLSQDLREDVELFENQLRYLIQIRQLKERILQEQRVDATQAEMEQEFLNEKHHVGGEMVTFESKDDAQRFYERMQEPGAWDTMKAEGVLPVRPVSMMTIEAYVDLWGVPLKQMLDFHALEIGAVGPPMAFGKQWAVYRLLEKRTGDLAEFPAQAEAYRKQVEVKKRYAGQQAAIKKLKESAKLKVFTTPETGRVNEGP